MERKRTDLSDVLKYVDSFAEVYLKVVFRWMEKEKCDKSALDFSLGKSPYYFPPDIIYKKDGKQEKIFNFKLPYKDHGAIGNRVFGEALKKGLFLLVLFALSFGSWGCAGLSDEVGEQSLEPLNGTLPDSSGKLELLDYLEMPQNEVIETLDLMSLDENTESLNILEEETYEGSYGTADFFLFFNQGEMKDIWLCAKAEGAPGICTLAGCDMALSREEAEKRFPEDCRYTGANDNMFISSLRLEKMGVLELILACNGNGDLIFISTEVSAEKLEVLKDLEYTWSNSTISFSNPANRSEVNIQVPQISVSADPTLSEKLNRIFIEGINNKLNQYGWDMNCMEEWEDVSIHIDYEKTFESAEYISVHYTGSIIADNGNCCLDFGTTAYTSAGGGMLELSAIFNDRVFNQYENDRTRYAAFNEEAAQDFNAKKYHYLDYYLLPSHLALLGDVKSGDDISNIKAGVLEYDTVSLLRDSISWAWDIYTYSDKDDNVRITICAPQIEVCLQDELKRNINGQIGEIIFGEIQKHGLNIDEIEKYENIQIVVNGDCIFSGEDERRFHLEGEIDSGGEKQNFQFEITVCLEKDQGIVSAEEVQGDG